ncbi:hypothetical protein JKF63_05566 [Porcisia hertigi]|uniref:Uncharacterized protein n=1 Tax=Porcisia hertigi TaxID=2761500 RepID=A0A836HPA9_9TRYP|nr:hypothetical protein JKF63_05566 [Porcisia hertigi]
MNGGLIALIVFGCIFTLYVVIGTIVRYRSGLHRCPEVLPNYYFWCSILNVVLRVVSCGRWRILCNRNNHTNDVYVLPSHPGATDRVQFELLVSDVDENYDVSRAMHPAEVIVKY